MFTVISFSNLVFPKSQCCVIVFPLSLFLFSRNPQLFLPSAISVRKIPRNNCHCIVYCFLFSAESLRIKYHDTVLYFHSAVFVFAKFQGWNINTGYCIFLLQSLFYEIPSPSFSPLSILCIREKSIKIKYIIVYWLCIFEIIIM